MPEGQQPGSDAQITPGPRAADVQHRGGGKPRVNATIVAFTRSPSQGLAAKGLAAKGIRVNAVSPGPIRAPLIPSTPPAATVASSGADVPRKRPGPSVGIAPAYVAQAPDDSSYRTGRVPRPSGGPTVNG
jgi:NAD(P)-dependent dehydrogenase (short-subunit alcohol dehydrogenase family)